MRDAFIARLESLAEHDPRVMLVTGDLGFGVLDRFARRFPSQYLNVGVAEQNMTGVAAGMALEGRIVFTYSIGNFPTLRCLEQIRSDAAYHGANVKIVSVGGGFSYGTLGMSHHATEDLAILRALPEVTVVAPGDDWEATEATSALMDTPGTCYLRLDRSASGTAPRPGEVFTLGRGRVVSRGSGVALIAAGGILGEAQLAAATLAASGIAPTVVSLHTIKPIDRGLILEMVSTHDAIVTVEEHVLNGGVGSAVAEVLVDGGCVPRRMRRIGLPDTYVSEVGTQEHLRRRTGLDAASIVRAVHELVGQL